MSKSSTCVRVIFMRFHLGNFSLFFSKKVKRKHAEIFLDKCVINVTTGSAQCGVTRGRMEGCGKSKGVREKEGKKQRKKERERCEKGLGRQWRNTKPLQFVQDGDGGVNSKDDGGCCTFGAVCCSIYSFICLLYRRAVIC